MTKSRKAENHESGTTERNPDGTFRKGKSGNPSGRPKRSELEKAVLSQIYDLAPQAVRGLKSLLENEETPPNIRLRAVEMVVNRICGTALNADLLEQYEEKIRFDGFSLSENDVVNGLYELMK